MQMVRLSLPLLLLLSPLCGAQDSADAKRRELEAVQQRLEQSRRELDNYRTQEQDLSRYISFLKLQADKARLKSTLIAREIEGLQGKLSESENRHKVIENSRRNWAAAFDHALARYARMIYASGPTSGSDELRSQAALRASAFNGASVLNLLREEDRVAREKIAKLEARTSDLSRNAKSVKKELDAKTQTASKSAAELEQARRKRADLEAELEELKKTARSLSDFLENFEKKQASSSRKTLSSDGDMPVSRHSLLWPVTGRVVSRYGKEQLPALKTWVFNEGIKIAAPRGAQVRSVEAGEVIYAGDFRTYGKVVIVDHKQGFFSIYGYLDRIAAIKGQQLQRGGLVGGVGEEQRSVLNEDDDRAALYFELRVGAKAVNPQLWLKNP